MTASIFRDTSQCLHVAFLMEILPPTQRSYMQVMIEAHMKACGIWNETKPTDRTINFGGMTPLEVRGQCAMVRGMVDHHLTAYEAAAVKTHYGYQKTKSEGVRGVVDYVIPLLTTCRSDAVLALAWGAFGNEKQRDGLSIRAVSAHYGLVKSIAHRDQQIIKRVARDMLARAVCRLEDKFQSSGLVENERSLQSA